MLSVFLTVIAFIITVLLRLRPVTSDALGEGLQALGSRHVFGEGLVSLSILVEPPPPYSHTHTHTLCPVQSKAMALSYLWVLNHIVGWIALKSQLSFMLGAVKHESSLQ